MPSSNGLTFGHAILVLVALLLAVTTVIFASLPLFLLRASLGFRPYAILCGVIAIALSLLGSFGLCIPFLCIALLVAVYEELKAIGCSLFSSGLASIFCVSGLFFLGLGLYIQYSGFDLSAFSGQKMQDILLSMSGTKVESASIDKLVSQLPSAVLMILSISLWSGLLLRRLVVSRGLARKIVFIDKKMETKLANQSFGSFKVPDFMIWPALIVLAMAFINFSSAEIEVLGSNLLNVFVMAYFYQGLVLVSYFFETYEIRSFWQTFWYIILVIHMFLLVSSIGFADYWMDFRSKIRKKPLTTA